MKPTDWVDVSDRVPEIQKMARERYEDKKNSGHYNELTLVPNTFLPGCTAEMGWEVGTGIPMDRKLYKGKGDGGVDFVHNDISYDIKGCMVQYPKLLEYVGKKKYAQRFVLLESTGWKVRVLGWCTLEQLLAGGVQKTYHGPRYVLTLGELNKLKQVGMPPGIEWAP